MREELLLLLVATSIRVWAQILLRIDLLGGNFRFRILKNRFQICRIDMHDCVHPIIHLISDGFYNIWLNPGDISSLGVVLEDVRFCRIATLLQGKKSVSVANLPFNLFNS